MSHFIAAPPPADLYEMERRLVASFREKLNADYEAACQHMDVEQLTDDQKFAVAVKAGVMFTSTVGDEGRLRFTTDPCVVMVVDGKWRVFTKMTGVV